MKREILRRRAVECALRQSERQSASLLDRSRHLQEELRVLSRRILSLQEDERRRISRELHDVVAQVLTSINVRLAVLKKQASENTRGLSGKISNAQRLVVKSVDIVHRFAHDLRPAVLDHLGLISALHAFVKTFKAETGLQVHLIAIKGANRLDSARRTVLYRVAQEALSNVARHARASRVVIRIQKCGPRVCMKITDDGRSFDVAHAMRAGTRRHIGLLGMRERVEMVGGRFRVDSAPGRGTTVIAEIPVRPVGKEIWTA
jgi:signal transduction histidine kinase